MPPYHGVDTRHVQSRERDARYLRDVPQRDHGAGQGIEPPAHDSGLRPVPSHDRLDACDVLARGNHAGYVRDVSQRDHRSGQSVEPRSHDRGL